MIDVNALMFNPFEEMEVGRKRAYAGYEAGQAAAQREALNELYAQALDPRTGQVNVNALYGGLAQRRMGAMIPGLEAEQAKLTELRAKAAQEETKSMEDRMRFWRRMIPTDSRLAPAWVMGTYNDPAVGPMLRQLGSPEDVIANIPNDPAGYAKWAESSALFADELIDAELKRRELGVREGTVRVQELQALTAAERENRLAAPPRAAGGGTATAPAAAPKEKPPQGYRWTATGNLEAIPGGPKDPNVVSTLTGKKTGGGSEAFEGVIGEMEAAYDELDRLAAIPSTKRRVAENLAISTRTSGFGQMVGRAAGTEEQSLRNQIASARLRLLQGIKAATGMSAQELNSNVELQQWLDAVTNPANDVESNRAILASIRSFVARRAGKEVSADSGKAPETGASIDALLNKYK